MLLSSLPFNVRAQNVAFQPKKKKKANIHGLCSFSESFIDGPYVALHSNSLPTNQAISSLNLTFNNFFNLFLFFVFFCFVFKAKKFHR
ncbi:Uncharacterized protein APZ42_021424 [Daphnia magna]|uniref:Uncharacterized protein n=1 Tax=Daphnia magna TaxID=35525 RepID=A0A164WNJ8_9CRUS|nr:Uncharacterized protein APZ42_021424 [Daphnia magna]